MYRCVLKFQSIKPEGRRSLNNIDNRACTDHG